MYRRSARVYDLLYAATGVKDYDAEAEELRRLVVARNPRARTLLDVCCGTGQHLMRLRRHFEVAGVDASEEMIAVARERLGDMPLWVADMRQLDLGRRFDAVTCLFGSIGYATELGELRTTMDRLAQHLDAGGVLVVDCWFRPDSWKEGHRPPPLVADDGDMTVVRLSTSSRGGRVSVMEMHHLVRRGQEVEHFSERHEMGLFERSEYVAAAAAAGLRVEVIADCTAGRDRLVATRPSA